jgi:hypothetical protein
MRSVLSAILFVAATAANAGGPHERVVIGSWSGGSYTNDKTGQFTHCAVSARYKSGVTMFASIGRDYGWKIGFSHPTWKLIPGTEIPVRLSFDGRSYIDVKAEPLDQNFFVIPMPDNSALIQAFRVASEMNMKILGKSFDFYLTKTSAMIPELAGCVRRNVTVAAAPVQQPATGVLPKQGNDTGLQSEAVTLATNFLLAAQLQNARMLRPDEAPNVGPLAVAWRAADASGRVQIIAPREGIKGIDVAADIAASDAKACGGKFASGRTAELVDSDVLFRAFSTCDDSEGLRYAEYYVVPRKRGGFAVFAVGSQGSNVGSSGPVETKRTVFQKAAIQATE